MKNITGYGNFLWPNTKPSSAMRHKLYRYFGFRCMISPQYFSKSLELPLAIHGYALDNGAYIAHKKGKLLPHDSFMRMVNKWGDGADFIVIPDVVGDASSTLSISWAYISKLVALGYKNKLLLCYQDGMNVADLHPYVAQGIGIFIGGTTEAKIKSIPWISSLCRQYNVWCHVGRVNTKKRVQMCIDYGCSSFDGSGWTMFPSTFSHIKEIEDDCQLSLFQHEKDTSLLKGYTERIKALGIHHSVASEYETKVFGTTTAEECISKKKTKIELSLFKEINSYPFLSSQSFSEYY